MGGETNAPKRDVPYEWAAQGPVAKMFHQIYKDRLEIFSADGQYSEDNIRP